MKKTLAILLLAALLLSGLSALASSIEITVPSFLEKNADPNKAVYEVRVIDQNGDPVPNCSVGFCLDTGCVPVECDENGVGIYETEPAVYHVKVIDAPEGYEYPEDTNVNTVKMTSSIVLTITKK